LADSQACPAGTSSAARRSASPNDSGNAEHAARWNRELVGLFWRKLVERGACPPLYRFIEAKPDGRFTIKEWGAGVIKWLVILILGIMLMWSPYSRAVFETLKAMPGFP
jgi:hypothetical protein